MNKNTTGFTIVELLVIIIVIAMIAAISVVTYNGLSRRAAEVTLKSDIKNAATQLELENADQGIYPGSDETTTSGDFLDKSSGTIFQYTRTGAMYCLTGTSDHTGVPAFMVSSDDKLVREGICSGHVDLTHGALAHFPATATLSAVGVAKTVVTNEVFSGMGTRLVNGDDEPVLGIDVEFTIEGGVFAGGAHVVTIKTNAAGIAVAPQASSPVAGSLIITARAVGQEVILPTVTVVTPAAGLSADVTVTPTTVSGKVVLAVSVVNTSEEPVAVKITTQFGTKTFASVASGATVQNEFSTYLSAIPAGSVAVTLTGNSGLALATATYAAY